MVKKTLRTLRTHKIHTLSAINHYLVIIVIFSAFPESQADRFLGMPYPSKGELDSGKSVVANKFF